MAFIKFYKPFYKIIFLTKIHYPLDEFTTKMVITSFLYL